MNTQAPAQTYEQLAAENERMRTSLTEILQYDQNPQARHVAARGLFAEYGTPNFCWTCTPKGIGYCRCEIACNE